MSKMSWASVREKSTKALTVSFLLAIAVELFTFWLMSHDVSHSKNSSQSLLKKEESQYIEADIFHLPQKAHLVEEKPIVKAPLQKELALSKTPNQGKPSQPGQVDLDEHNQTEDGSPIDEDHGPIAVIAPLPVIPNHLKDHELNTHVVIDFYVTTEGLPNPRLVASSENHELDAIALESAQKWRFRPARQNKKPIAARVRLRIVFAVE